MPSVIAGPVAPVDATFAALDVIRSIPPGRVMSYGDVAEAAGLSSARTVGRILSRHGHLVPWQRVVRADGTCAPPVRREQVARLRSEGVAVRDGRVEMATARWRPPG